LIAYRQLADYIRKTLNFGLHWEKRLVLVAPRTCLGRLTD